MKYGRQLIALLALFTLITIPSPSHAVSANPTAVCAGATCTVTFPFTGDYYAWTVPKSDTYTLEVWGAQGGNAGYNGTVITYGGLGGYSTGSRALTLNQTIYIYVGGQGAGASGTGTGDTMTGGYNGGGDGLNGTTSTYRGSGGGGATDIRSGGTALANRILVGGGGGGGVGTDPYGTIYPGVGGGTTGGNGATSSYNSTYPYHGKGGTQSTGGAGGSNGSAATAGTLGIGGNGTYFSYGVAGGGGGYYGGGGSGGGMGSGGGSGYKGGVTSGSTIDGASTMVNPAGGTMIGRSGNGLARITYSNNPSTSVMSSFNLAGNVFTAIYRTPIAINATSSVAAKITFKSGKTIIPGCKNLQTTGSDPNNTATCQWKPSSRGSVIITATSAPNNIATSGSAGSLIVSVANRSTKR